MVRDLNKKRYLLAAFLTILVFILGLLLGLVIESQRAGYVEKQGKIQELNYMSQQIQYQFVDQLGQENNCEAVAKTFDKNVENLESIRARLEEYGKNANVNREEFEILRREYTLAEIRYWLLAKKTKELCHTDMVTVLYFFSGDDECADCNEQSFILTYLKKRLKDKLLNFAIYSKIDEPMVSILLNTYNITKYPTLVIEDKKSEGFISKEDLLTEICKNYRSVVEDCT